MKHMTLQEIAAACRGTYFGSKENAVKSVSSVVIDSRKVQKDSLFVAIRGARVDGHTFIPQTIEHGALCALSEKDLGDVDYSYIRVDSCEQALKDLAEHYRRSLDIKVVGISGSVGKTSTKEMIASILGQKYHVLKTEGNFNNEIGLPLTIFNIREEHEIAVLEMGISHFGDMGRLARIARPDVCVITNIGYAHLENLGSRDGILQEKTDMISYMNPDGAVILNGDDDKLAGFTPKNGLTPVYFGQNPDCRYRAEAVKDEGMRGTTATFITPESCFTAHISIPGSHMVYNALAGTAVGRFFGLSDDEIKAGIEALKPLPGRNHLIETDTFTIIDDCYNANPASMKASLDVLAGADTRTVAILGDMFELGENERQMHREVGEYAAALGISVLVCIGELSREMAAAAEHSPAESPGKTAIYHYASKTDFYREMADILSPGDTILVKASHGMKFSEIVDKLEKGE